MRFQKKPELRKAYEAGLDYAKNGANTTNCHFSIFSDPSKTVAWEEGTRDGKKGMVES